MAEKGRSSVDHRVLEDDMVLLGGGVHKRHANHCDCRPKNIVVFCPHVGVEEGR